MVRRLRRTLAAVIAHGGKQRRAQLVAVRLAAQRQVLFHPLGGVRPQVRDPVAGLAAHQQRQVLALLGEILDVGAMDLDGAQRLQRHHADHEQIAQPPDLLVTHGLVGIGDHRQEPGQFLIAEVFEVLGGLAHARGLHAGGGIVGAQAGVARRLIEPPHDGELPADGDGVVVVLDQRLAVALDVRHCGGRRIEALLDAPGDPQLDLVAVVADGVLGGIAAGHVDAQEVGEGGVQLGGRPWGPVR